MSSRRTSSWRWLLLVVMVAMIGARVAMFRCWVHRTVITGGGGPPAVLVNLSTHGRTIATWDWVTNHMEPIATFPGGPIASGMQCTSDGKFVWFADDMLHTIDLHPPHERHAWTTTLPSGHYAGYYKLVGASANSRFVVVQCTPPPSDPTAPYTYETDLRVIDLHTGEEVSPKHWNSDTKSTFVPGEFKSVTWQPPAGALRNVEEDWRLTDQGAWELLPPDPNRHAFVEVVEDGAGGYRGLSDDERLNKKLRYESTDLEAVSPDGQHVLRRRGRIVRMFPPHHGELLLAHTGRRDVQVLETTNSHFVNASFTLDGKHVLVDDIFGDIQVFESETGRIVARTSSGWAWHWIVFGLSAGFAMMAACWLFLAFRQKLPLWTIVDLHAAAIAGQLGIFSLWRVAQTQIAPDILMPFTLGLSPVATAALGIGVGWYWAYSRANFVTKFKWGALSILAIGVVPAITMVADATSGNLAVRLVVPSFAGLFAASVTAVLLWPIGTLGWRASDEPISFQARRFGLASMMLLTGGVAIAAAFLRLVLNASNVLELFAFVLSVVPIAVVGFLLPSLLLMNLGNRWPIALGIGVALLHIIVTGAWCYQATLLSTQWSFRASLFSFAAATGLVILAMAMLARKHGWRWRMAQPLVSEVSSLETAR
jgi:hypothetical protein